MLGKSRGEMSELSLYKEHIFFDITHGLIDEDHSDTSIWGGGY